jgi:hypothetical protein
MVDLPVISNSGLFNQWNTGCRDSACIYVDKVASDPSFPEEIGVHTGFELNAEVGSRPREFSRG